MVSGPESQPGNQLQGRHRAAVVTGVGSWLPARVVTNHDLSAELDTSDEWIRSRTGIARRHVIDEGMATSDLAVEAGFRALKPLRQERGSTEPAPDLIRGSPRTGWGDERRTDNRPGT